METHIGNTTHYTYPYTADGERRRRWLLYAVVIVCVVGFTIKVIHDTRTMVGTGIWQEIAAPLAFVILLSVLGFVFGQRSKLLELKITGDQIYLKLLKNQTITELEGPRSSFRFKGMSIRGGYLLKVYQYDIKVATIGSDLTLRPRALKKHYYRLMGKPMPSFWQSLLGKRRKTL